MAIVAFLVGNSYKEVLRIVISLGGDADTIACMASSISVHLYGVPQGLYKDGQTESKTTSKWLIRRKSTINVKYI